MKSSRIIKIATRASKLALWQANAVKAALENNGHTCELVTIETTGDVDLKQPIYAMGITGIFTKQLDIALLNKQADIAVHSLKDVPTQLADNLLIAAVLQRGASEDVVIAKSQEILSDTKSVATIATSSLRRQAQWLAKYPNHKVVPIRGNVQTRLKKFAEDKNMGAVIFAKAGLERLGLLPTNAVVLDWMLPAPAQGVVGIACRADDTEMIAALKEINHAETFITSQAERQFLKTLMGGCSVPISAFAKVVNDKLDITGVVHDFNGQKKNEVHLLLNKAEWENAGQQAAIQLLNQPGAKELLETIRNKSIDEAGSID